jgi:ADP-ribose pyrophosphatase YjhB (NUDIX family)
MSTDNRHSVSVAGVIIDDEGRALLIQRRDNGHWEPPGGVLEHGETIDEALRREILEETGLTIEPGPLTGVYQNMTRHIVALVFRCTQAGGHLVENDEVSAFRWATPNEIRELMTEAYATRILDGLRDGGTSVRAHDGTYLLST